MILSPTHFDTPATGETTVPLLHSDTASKGAVKGDVARSDRSRSGSFDVIFATSDAVRSKPQGLAAHSTPQAGPITDATQQDKPDGDALAIIETESAENADTQALPEVINPEAPPLPVQRSQVAPNQGAHSGDASDTSVQSSRGAIKRPADVPDVAVKPDGAISQAPNTPNAGHADPPAEQVGALRQTSHATAFDLAALSGSQKSSSAPEPSANTHNQTAIYGSHSAQTGKTDQSRPDVVLPAVPMRSMAAESPSVADPTAQKTEQAALPGHFVRAPTTAKPASLSIQGLGVTSPVAAGLDRQAALMGPGGASQALQPEGKVRLRDGAWSEAAPKADRHPTHAPGLATSAVSDGASSKVAQAVFPTPAVSTGVAPLEEVSLSRVGFQSDLGAVADQRPMADIMTAGRSDGPARSDLPRHVAAQLAEAVQRGGGGDRPIELTLNPAELGRVRISMAPGDGTIVVTVLAERGETLDLMRRHADQLAQDFHDLGYGSAEFSFGQNSDGSASDQGGAAGGTAVPSDAIVSPGAEPEPIHLRSDRVDIRL